MNLFYALIASFAISFISLVGAVALLVNDRLLQKVILLLVAFAAGSLVGGAFLEIIPEAMEQGGNVTHLFLYVILGYVLFFALEKYLHWRHANSENQVVHTFTYLNIAGDGIHNFTDGLIIGAVFFVDVRVGVATTLAVIFHEIPHELGNFMVLVYGGFSRMKALFFNFLSAIFAVAGTLAGYYFAHKINGFAAVLLPAAAGGFIYIASCDLIPELHKEVELKKSALIVATFALGIALMYVLKVWL